MNGDHRQHAAQADPESHASRTGSAHPKEHAAHPATHTAHPASHAAHDKHAGHSPEMFRSKFWLSLALTVLIVVLSADVQMWLGYEVPAFKGSEFIPALFGTVVFLYGGLVFLRGPEGEIGHREARSRGFGRPALAAR